MRVFSRNFPPDGCTVPAQIVTKTQCGRRGNSACSRVRLFEDRDVVVLRFNGHNEAAQRLIVALRMIETGPEPQLQIKTREKGDRGGGVVRLPGIAAAAQRSP